MNKLSEHYSKKPLPPEWFETILCSLSDGVFCVDENWRIIYFNQAASEITGVPKQEALGRPCHEVFRSNICAKACALCYTKETGTPIINMVISIVNSKGDRVPISISTALLKDEQGRVVGGVETFRDLTLVEQLRKELDKRHTFRDIVSKSAKMQHIFDIVPTIAESDSTVLITGESGTGKGLLVRAIHNLSRRKDSPFVAVNCGAIPDTLLESELFGYKAGAFTGARHDKPGRFARAQGGTIFLDEIGDITADIQAKLLGVLQEKTFEPLGGVQTVKADVRVLVATNRNLEELVHENRFRTDLYYRINVFRLDLPPLRERIEDVPLLVNHFIARLSAMKAKDVAGITPEALGILMNHPYPGNVRELENIIEHAFVLCPGGMITVNHLPGELKARRPPETSTTVNLVAQYEKELILNTLERNNWNRLQTARELGIHKSTLFRKIRKLGIDLPGKDGRSRE